MAATGFARAFDAGLSVVFGTAISHFMMVYKGDCRGGVGGDGVVGLSVFGNGGGGCGSEEGGGGECGEEEGE